MFLWSALPWPVASFTIGSAFLAIVLNVTQLPIIMFRSSNAIGNYKYLLASYTVSIIVFSIVQFFHVPAFTVGPEGFVFHSTSNIWNRPYSFPTLITYISCYVQIAVILTLSYVYRYAVLDRSSLLSNLFKFPQVLGTVGVAMGVWIYSLVICLMFMRPTRKSDNMYSKMVYDLHGVNLTEAGYCGGPLYTDGTVNFGMMLWLISFAVLGLGSIAIVTIMIFKILKLIRLAGDRGSQTAKRIHKQIFNLLVLQSICPVIFTIGPTLVAIVLTIMSTQLDIICKYIASIMTIGLFCHPILVYYYISEYRKYFLSILYKITGSKRLSSIVSSLSFEQNLTNPNNAAVVNPIVNKTGDSTKTTR